MTAPSCLRVRVSVRTRCLVLVVGLLASLAPVSVAQRGSQFRAMLQQQGYSQRQINQLLGQRGGQRRGPRGLAQPNQYLANELVHSLPLPQQSTGLVVAPLAPKRKPPVAPLLILTMQTPMADTAGYVPVTFKIEASAPSQASREITVRFTAMTFWGSSEVVSCEETFELPAGQQTVAHCMLVPKFCSWQQVAWETWVDGRRDKDLSTVGVNCQTTSNANQSALVAVPLGEDWSAVAKSTGLNTGSVQLTGKSFDLLPTQWLGYTALDTLIVRAADLDQLVQSFPRQTAAMLAWVRAGGNLWVMQAGPEWPGWAFEEYRRGSLVEHSEMSLAKTKEEHWRAVSTSSDGYASVDLLLQSLGNGDVTEGAEPEGLASKLKLLTDGQGATSRNVFVVHPHGLGLVTAFYPAKGWQQVLSPFEYPNQFVRNDWATRHGNSPMRENLAFNNFLIPGVGLAPVTEFQLLITLFVLVIGPLNYWLLSRAKKLPLILLFTPLAAGLTTLLLFGYGYLTDGTGVQVRARSVMLLDQRTGEAASWARLSYYAGFAPGEGLRLPYDTALYPIHPVDTFNRHRYGAANNRALSMLWQGKTQVLDEGWLVSRTPTQYQSITSRSIQRRVEVSQQGEQLTIDNQLGTDILAIAVQDGQGRYYWGTEVPQGEALTLEKQEYRAVKVELMKRFRDSEPTFPAGSEPARGSLGNRVRPFLGSLMEVEIAAVISPVATQLGKNQYVAITREGVLVEDGLEERTRQASFHVVKGKFSLPKGTEPALRKDASKQGKQQPDQHQQSDQDQEEASL